MAHPSGFLFQRADALSGELGRPGLHSRVLLLAASPLLVAQWVAGRIKARYLSELSLSLIIQQVLKCLVSVSVWSASLTALPVIAETGLNSHQACALLQVTNARCVFSLITGLSTELGPKGVRGKGIFS